MVDQGSPKRASFFLSSSISSVIGTAPSDIFSALWKNFRPIKLNNKMKRKLTAVCFSPPKLHLLVRLSRQLYNNTPVFERTFTDQSQAQSQLFSQPMKNDTEYRAVTARFYKMAARTVLCFWRFWKRSSKRWISNVSQNTGYLLTPIPKSWDGRISSLHLKYRW